MKYAARVALGVAGGYILGRTKKMKLAMMLAGTAAGRQAGGPAALLGQGGSAALLGQGKKLLEASPELSRLADEVRGRLLEAGKGAALAVAARQVDSLTDRLAGPVESALSNLTAGGRPPTKASQADQDVTDDEAGVEEEEEEEGTPDADRDEQDGATSGPADDSHTNAAARSARRSKGATGAVTRGAWTTARRNTATTSGTRRAADKAVGRSARARERNANG